MQAVEDTVMAELPWFLWVCSWQKFVKGVASQQHHDKGEIPHLFRVSNIMTKVKSHIYSGFCCCAGRSPVET